MNTLFVITCETCQQDTDCRLGFSNRTIQPLRFSCPHCASLIEITLDIRRAPAYDLSFKNGSCLDDHQYGGPFDDRHPFVDLHLDFPVSFGKYAMGLTPFMRAMQQAKAIGQNGMEGLQRMQWFNHQIELLNYFSDKAEDAQRAIKLYFGKNKQLFKQRVENLLEIKLGTSLLPQDVNAALYRLLSRMFLPFIHAGAVKDFVEQVTEMIMALAETNTGAFNDFVDHIVASGFLTNVQRDCIELYPYIYRAELALRPAIFLDLVDGSEDQMIAGRVSADDFPAYKDLYKDLCEVLARQLNLVAGVNNVIKRGDYNAFLPSKDGPGLSSLDKFADKTLSDKFKYLDDCWFVFDRDVVNTGIRNAIAHHITEYDEVTQLITYFPEKEGIRQDKQQAMTFLAFLRLILQIFREVHYLHHVIKCLLNYEFLIRSKTRGTD